MRTSRMLAGGLCVGLAVSGVVVSGVNAAPVAPAGAVRMTATYNWNDLPVWSKSTRYSAGQVVRYGERAYEARKSNRKHKPSPKSKYWVIAYAVGQPGTGPTGPAGPAGPTGAAGGAGGGSAGLTARDSTGPLPGTVVSVTTADAYVLFEGGVFAYPLNGGPIWSYASSIWADYLTADCTGPAYYWGGSTPEAVAATGRAVGSPLRVVAVANDVAVAAWRIGAAQLPVTAQDTYLRDSTGTCVPDMNITGTFFTLEPVTLPRAATSPLSLS